VCMYLCREKMPFVSTFAHSKLLLRAANLDDVKLLKQYIDDCTYIAKVCPLTVLHL